MAFGVKIDFEKTFPLWGISPDLHTAFFESDLSDGFKIPVKIAIDNEEADLLDNVFNLAFGPINQNGKIHDKATLNHSDPSRVFSTVLSFAYRFLRSYPGKFIGIDGSDNLRAFYYWRFLQRNYDYLNTYFKMYAASYYVRISRFGKRQFDNPFDFEDVRVASIPITRHHAEPATMFNYFQIRLNS